MKPRHKWVSDPDIDELSYCVNCNIARYPFDLCKKQYYLTYGGYPAFSIAKSDAWFESLNECNIGYVYSNRWKIDGHGNLISMWSTSHYPCIGLGEPSIQQLSLDL